MKRILKGVFIAFAFFFSLLQVNAESACSYSEQAELNEIAGNVRASYEAKTEVVGQYEDPDMDKSQCFNFKYN